MLFFYVAYMWGIILEGHAVIGKQSSEVDYFPITTHPLVLYCTAISQLSFLFIKQCHSVSPPPFFYQNICKEYNLCYYFIISANTNSHYLTRLSFKSRLRANKTKWSLPCYRENRKTSLLKPILLQKTYLQLHKTDTQD